MSHKYLEHATDALIEVVANSLEQAFEEAGISVVDTILDISTVEEINERTVEIISKDLNNLLYSWLEELIIITITEGFVTKRFSVKLMDNNGFKLTATLIGENLDIQKHHFKVEIKAPTFHLMEIEKNKQVRMRFLLDL